MAKKPAPVVIDYDGKRPKGPLIDGARELMEDFEAEHADNGIWWTREELEKRNAPKD